MFDAMIQMPALTQPGMGKGLLFPVTPEPGETLLSYVVRCVGGNYLGNPRSFVQAADINLVMKGDFLSRMGTALPRLAELLRVPPEKLQSLWGAEPLDANGRRRLGGVFLRPHLIYQNGRRYLPSLKAGHPDDAMWMVREMNFCARTWQLLVDTCPTKECGKRLTWPSATSLHLCNHCHTPLAEWKARTVPKSDRAALSWLVNLFSEDARVVDSGVKKVPAFFEVGAATDAFELAVAFGQAIFRTSEQNADWHPSHLAAGVRLLLEYPRSLWDLCASVAQENSQQTFLAHLYRIGRDHRDPVLTRNVRKLVVTHRRHRSAVDFLRVNKFKKVRLREAGKTLGLGTPVMKQLIENGHFTDGQAIKFRWRMHLSLRRVAKIKDILDESISVSDFRRLYSLPEVAVDQLLASGIVLASNEIPAQIVHSGRAIDRPSANSLLYELYTLPLAPTDGSFVPLVVAFLGVGGRMKPWAATIMAGINGVLPGGLARLKQGEETQLAIDARIGRAMIMGGPDFRSPCLAKAARPNGFARPLMQPNEVEAYLNCTAQDISWLRKGQLLKPIEAERTQYHAPDVEALGLQFMTSREAAARLGVSPTCIRNVLADYPDVFTIGQGFYPRQELEHVLKQIAPDQTCWS